MNALRDAPRGLTPQALANASGATELTVDERTWFDSVISTLERDDVVARTRGRIRLAD